MPVQPGKPGAPAERVEVRREEDLCRISAARISPEGEVLAAGEGRLDHAACEAIWRDVARLDLASFAPRMQAGPADDFGSVTLDVAWSGDRAPRHWSWSRPLLDPDRADALAAVLARGAHAAAPDVALAYFPGAPPASGD
jgi:hypothetical protein